MKLMHNWQSSFKNAYKKSHDLFAYLNNDQQIDTQQFNDKNYPIFIPKDFAKRIKLAGENSPLWKQFVPATIENHDPTQLSGLVDPIGDQIHAKGNGIIHRYKNRILFTPTTVCPIHCRYCFRKNELYGQNEFLSPNIANLISYLNDHSEVEEVIFTGGDPLILSNQKIEQYLESLANIPSVKYIRFHTRTPIILPERIDEDFAKLLQSFTTKFDTISLVIHVNHSQELSEDLKLALTKLSGINLLSQSVLLKGVNDDTLSLKDLFIQINKMGIRPYYLHHPDLVKGAMHFYLSLEEGRKIYGELRDLLPGWLIPHYVIDPASGQGKTLAYNPESIEFQGSLLDRFSHSHKYQQPN